eukprot:776788-Karenia_brevis.AAC.1
MGPPPPQGTTVQAKPKVHVGGCANVFLMPQELFPLLGGCQAKCLSWACLAQYSCASCQARWGPLYQKQKQMMMTMTMMM